MNILEKIVEEANKGELARIEKAVQCAKSTNVMTDHYTSTGPEIEDETIVPPHVDAGDIIDEMYRDHREQMNDNIRQEDMPYFTQNSGPIVEKDEDIER